MGLAQKAVGFIVRFSLELTVFIVLFIAAFIVFFPPQFEVTGTSAVGRAIPGSSPGALVYFLQISDVHISKHIPYRGEQFLIFCNETIPVINPALVIHTGDITDGLKNPPKSPHYLTAQVEEEWDFYQETLESFGYFNKSFWLDVRGNHDVYTISGYEGEENFYPSHAVHGGERDYHFVLETGFGSYQFASLDLGFELGLTAPYEFFGLLPQNLTRVSEAVNSAHRYNHTIMFGHYPRATTTSRFPWGDLMRGKVLAYLCGHTHLDKMYSVMPENYLELELEDMKSHKKYRIMSYDHDLFSFTDTLLRTWPLVHITNPKDARFLSDQEPLDLISLSTHIRVLVFSPNPIASVTLYLDADDQGIPMTLAEIGNPLYVAPWDPSTLSPGLHTLMVKATDSEGSQNTTIQFSVDKTRAYIARTRGNFFQHAPTHGFIEGTFALIYVYSLVVMLLFPKIYTWAKNRTTEKPKENGDSEAKKPADETLWETVKREAWRKIEFYNSLSLVNFGVLLFFWINLAIGPIAIGPLLGHDRYGASFLWGVVANGAYTYSIEGVIMAWMFLVALYLPAFHLLAHIDQATSKNTSLLKVNLLLFTLVFLVATGFIFYMIVYYVSWSCLFLSPGITWFIVATLVLVIWGLVKYHRATKGSSNTIV